MKNKNARQFQEPNSANPEGYLDATARARQTPKKASATASATTPKRATPMKATPVKSTPKRAVAAPATPVKSLGVDGKTAMEALRAALEMVELANMSVAELGGTEDILFRGFSNVREKKRKAGDSS